MDADYYDFLQKMPLNDQSMLVSREFHAFINRLEFSKPLFFLNRSTSVGAPRWITFQDYLFKELGLAPTAEDIEYLDGLKVVGAKMLAAKNAEERNAAAAGHSGKAKAFLTAYKKYQEEYNQKYPAPKSTTTFITQGERLLRDWKMKDSIFTNYFGLKPSLAYEIAKVRSLKFAFNDLIKNNKDDARTFLSALEKGISHPYLIKQAEEIFRQQYPANAKSSYPLPEGKGTEILRKITDQFKGKMVLVDFWATTCAPCVAEIEEKKSVRARYKDSEDLEFVFLTSENESPESAYNSFIKKRELVNTHRLSADEFRYLRQLVKFNGIPRYVLLDREGKVADDDFDMFNFESQIALKLVNK